MREIRGADVGRREAAVAVEMPGLGVEARGADLVGHLEGVPRLARRSMARRSVAPMEVVVTAAFRKRGTCSDRHSAHAWVLVAGVVPGERRMTSLDG